MAEGPAGAGAPSGAALGLHLQWRTEDLPPGVSSSWTPPADGSDEHVDDPADGLVETHDPAWDAATTLLAQDPEFLTRRSLLDGIDLHVVIRETDEATLTAYPDQGPTTSVVLELPASDHRDADGGVLPVPDRTEVHLQAVVTLVVETQAALGLEQ